MCHYDLVVRRTRNMPLAFTLVEVLVILAIVVTLFGLTCSAVMRAREAARRAACRNNLRQIGIALGAYESTHTRLPTGVSYANGVHPHPFMSWLTRILPFVGQEGLWERTLGAFEMRRRFKRVPPHIGFTTLMALYTCPNDGRVSTRGGVNGVTCGFTSYLGVEGIDLVRKDGLLFLDSQVRSLDIRDGLSNTLIVGERPPSALGDMGWWYAGEGQRREGSGDMLLGVQEVNIYPLARACSSGPYTFTAGQLDNNCDAFHFWSLHPGGAHFLFADGSVRFLAYSANPIMPALATRAGGEVVSVP